MSDHDRSPASSLAMPLLATSPPEEHGDDRFETDGDHSNAGWTPQDSPRNQHSIGSGGQPMCSPFSAYRDTLSHQMKHSNMRESRARCVGTGDASLPHCFATPRMCMTPEKWTHRRSVHAATAV